MILICAYFNKNHGSDNKFCQSVLIIFYFKNIPNIAELKKIVRNTRMQPKNYALRLSPHAVEMIVFSFKFTSLAHIIIYGMPILMENHTSTPP